MAGVMSTMAFCAVFLGFFVALGRSATSAAHRRPLRACSARELAVDALRGARMLVALHGRRRSKPVPPLSRW